ncbi:MAG TPA: hypothetical protein VFY89_04980 [Ktedonobacterales bacterium]
MHADQQPQEWAEMPLTAPRDGARSGPLFPTSGPLTPPRLTPLGDTASARRVVAELRFPGGLVQARANEYAQAARVAGRPHTLRLWRECCREALIALARLTTGVPESAVCESLSWQLDGQDYLVAVTLTPRAPRVVH